MAQGAAQQHERQELLGRRIALLSMAVGVVLAAVKIAVGIHARSTALVSDGCEAGADVLSSGFVYAGLWLASRPPDAEHPYGHGRYETLAGLAVGALLLLTGAAIFWSGFVRFNQTNELHAYALYPLLAAFFLKISLAAMKFRVGRTIHSSSLTADAWHDITDLLSTTVAFIAIGLAIINPARFRVADHIGGVFIGGIIFFLSVRVVLRTVGQLIDTMPEPSKMAEIRSVALSVPGALGIEKCYARPTGLRYHVDLHLEVDPDMTVRESHEIAGQVKRCVREKLDWVADVLVHVEPARVAAVGRGRPLERVRGE
jgi:cation diffusion facilitator family transporter